MPARYGAKPTKSFSARQWAPRSLITRAMESLQDQPTNHRLGSGFCNSKRRSKESIMNKPVVLITGGLTGIGRAAALAFAKKGANVVVAGRRDEAGKALVKELRSFGSEAEFINADVRKDDDVHALVDKTVARFGRLDVAVNNAGTEGQVGPITDQTAESYAATFDTNVLGVILSMKHEVRVMQRQGSGSIIEKVLFREGQDVK